MFLVTSYLVSILLCLLLFAVPQRLKPLAGLTLSSIAGAITTYWSWLAWSAGEFVLHTRFEFWGGSPDLHIDRLSAFFLVIVNLVSFLGFVYSVGYLKPFAQRKSSVALGLHVISFFLLQVSMQHVLMLREGTSFLMAWELMSATSFILVIFEGEHQSTLKTGIQYLLQMHIGFVFILVSFLWAFAATGTFGWTGLERFMAGAHFPWIILFMLAGFGIKAGFVPLHTWLPHAHPAAPTHVSAVMSGVMIKMGLYGILRTVTSLQQDFLFMGYLFLVISCITGLTGILYSAFQRDLKKVLAYSSIENIGLIGVGLGIALLGKAYDSPLYLNLGWTAVFVHILNHSLYKPLLFFGAGNVYYASHTRSLDLLGGLIHRLPVTGACFLIGAIAICGIPPLNGFVSDFLLYKAAFLTLAGGSFYTSLLGLAVALVLTLIGGLALFSFTRAFGVTFLGSRRTSTTRLDHLPGIMNAPALIIVPLMAFIALAPGHVIRTIQEISPSFPYLPLNPSLADPVSGMPVAGAIGAVLVAFVVLILLTRRYMTRNQAVNAGPTWGCGYTGGDYRHQYTATTLSENLRELSAPVLASAAESKPFGEQEIFPDVRRYHSATHDLVEKKVIDTPVEKVLSVLKRAAWGQTGSVHHYLIYPLIFILLMALISLLA
jgi:formate hydrogenlyase subunit 3/multisubunit Na+/H+ antiporter MnhD subunit